MKISVIIPTYNRERFIGRAIKSVKNQTYKIDEIIVIDNNSDDNTIKLIKKYHNDIKIFKENKKGVSYARNYGILKSKNNWLAFLDSDDEWMDDKIEEQVKYIRNSKKSFSFIHSNEVWFRKNIQLNQKKKHKKNGGYIFEDCLDNCKISPSSTLIKKNLFSRYGKFDHSFMVCEDYELWLRITSKEKIGYIHKPLIKKYGGHKGQLSKQYWGLDRFRVKALEKLVLNFKITEKQKLLAINKIIKKINILLLGGYKRNKKVFIKNYETKKSFWQNYLKQNYDN